MERIKRQLLAGKSIIVTSGLYRAFQGHGIEDVVEMNVSGRRFLSDGYATGYSPANREVLSNRITRALPVRLPAVVDRPA